MFIQEKTISKRAYNLTNSISTDPTASLPINTQSIRLLGKQKSAEKTAFAALASSTSDTRSRRIVSFKRKLLALIFNPRGSRAALVTVMVLIAVVIYAVSAAYVGNSTETGFVPTKTTTLCEYSSFNRVFLGYEPTVNVTIDLGDGNVITSNMPQLTVSEFIDSLDVELGNEDTVSQPLDAVLTDDMTIAIQKTEYREVTLTENIPYSTEYIESQTIPKGTQQVTTAGQYGVSTRVLQQKYVDDKLESETVLSESITQKPVNRVVTIGVGGTLTGADGVTRSYSYYIDVKATAYCIDGRTATGKATEEGIIAVDASVIPLGTKVYLSGNYGDYGVCSAEDVGGGVTGNKIDIWMPTYEECRAFGVRNMRMYILG